MMMSGLSTRKALANVISTWGTEYASKELIQPRGRLTALRVSEGTKVLQRSHLR